MYTAGDMASPTRSSSPRGAAAVSGVAAQPSGVQVTASKSGFRACAPAERAATRAGTRRRARARDRVAFLAPNVPALLEAHFGVALAGGVLVAINTRLNEGEVAYILDHSGARLLFVDAELAGPLAPIRAGLRTVERVVTIEDP